MSNVRNGSSEETAVSDEFMGSGAKTVPFEQVGDSVTGIIVSPPEPRNQTDPETGEQKFFKNGQPMIMWAVKVSTNLRDPQDPFDDGERMLYLKWKSLDAVRNAVRASGSTGLQPGGQLTLTLSGFGPKPKPAWSAPKEWQARYVPPPQGYGQPDFLDNGGQQQQTQQSTPQQQTVLQRLAAQHDNNPMLRPAPVQTDNPPF